MQNSLAKGPPPDESGPELLRRREPTEPKMPIMGLSLKRGWFCPPTGPPPNGHSQKRPSRASATLADARPPGPSNGRPPAASRNYQVNARFALKLGKDAQPQTHCIGLQSLPFLAGCREAQHPPPAPPPPPQHPRYANAATSWSKSLAQGNDRGQVSAIENPYSNLGNVCSNTPKPWNARSYKYWSGPSG